MKDVLKKYIIEKYGKEHFEEIIKQNYLNCIYIDNPHNVKFLLNKANVISLQNELIKICHEFDEQKIKYITFKGVVLSNRLYDNAYMRFFSDIDIFVFPQYFEKALDVLYNKGYVPRYPNVLSGPHHAALKNGKIIVELHRKILNPFTKIDESYMYNHTEILYLSKQSIMTLDLTGTLLHLFYHLYMDTWISFNNKYYAIYTTKQLPSVNRFLARAYEIALFSEKYFKQIKWEEIIKDMKKQKLRIIFKTMINDILEIFPNTFPKCFIDDINNMEYESDEEDIFYKYIADSNSSKEDIGVILSKFIDSQWNNRASENIKIDAVGEFSLNSPIIRDLEVNKNYLLGCIVQIEKKDDGLKLTFRVTNDDFCFSEINDYNTQKSDGVHLIICGTNKYSFNSIFLFPKIIDDKIVVIPVNVLNEVNSEIDETLISTSYEKLETEYIITAILKNEFLKMNNIDEYFYLGLVISDCSNQTNARKSELILANPHNEWYNPVYFAKISLI